MRSGRRYPSTFPAVRSSPAGTPHPSAGSGALNDRGPTGPSDERISRLSAAILRISQSLELATVLEVVVEGARALTGARSGVITTIDERGQVQDFVTSGLPWYWQMSRASGR